MIDFRFHLVSIVAVLLALAVGIVVGSGFLGGQLLRRLEEDVRDLGDTNTRLRDTVAERNRTIEEYRAFADAVDDQLLVDALQGRSVTFVTIEGSNAQMLDSLRAAVLQAGGTVPSTLTFSARLALATPEDREELGAILDSNGRAAGDLRRDLGSTLGTRAAAATQTSFSPTRLGTSPGQRLADLVQRLSDAGYLGAEVAEGTAAPQGSMFVIAAGSAGAPPFAARGLIGALALSVAERGAIVLVAEPSDSTWEVVTALRDDGDVRDLVPTVDHAEGVVGQVAAVLALREAAVGRVGHYGIGPEAEGVVPEPQPAAAG